MAEASEVLVKNAKGRYVLLSKDDAERLLARSEEPCGVVKPGDKDYERGCRLAKGCEDGVDGQIAGKPAKYVGQGFSPVE